MSLLEQAQKNLPAPHTLEVAGKTGVGISGSLLTMSLNEWAGLVVAVLTAIYMVLQIQDIIRKRRKDAKQKNSN